MNVENDGGVSAFVKLVLAMNKKMGKKKTMELVEENPNVFKELIYSQSDSDRKTVIDAVKAWESKNIEEILLRLRLTSYQNLILEFIFKNKNEITLDNLEKEFSNIGMDISTGSVIGGSIAGISKKCERLRIPVIIKIVKSGKGKYIYSLVPEVYEHLKKSQTA